MSNENQSENKPLTPEERKEQYILKLKWTTFFQAGFFVAIAGYLSKFGWQLYSLNGDKKVLILIAILYLGAWGIAYQQYKGYVKESGKTW